MPQPDCSIENCCSSSEIGWYGIWNSLQKDLGPNGGEEVHQLVLLEAWISGNVEDYRAVETAPLMARYSMFRQTKDCCQTCQCCSLPKSFQPTVRTPVDHLMAARPNQSLAIDFTFLEPAQNTTTKSKRQ